MFAVAILLIWAGCASTPRIDWSARVGHYTYDQALEELGPPAKSAHMSDGSMVADWLTQSSRTIVTQGPVLYNRWGYTGVATPTTVINTPNYFLRLTFDPASKLRSWKKVAE